jgi:hypothetical protein
MATIQVALTAKAISRLWSGRAIAPYVTAPASRELWARRFRILPSAFGGPLPEASLRQGRFDSVEA